LEKATNAHHRISNVQASPSFGFFPWMLGVERWALDVSAMIRVVLPFHLRTLARVTGEVQIDVAEPITIDAVLDALEQKFPVLCGTVRDHGTLKRRPFIRFFACREDLSLEPPDKPLPAAVRVGTEPFCIIGAMAGG
jgi:hypothetical protein